jgi:hypothetical protein
MSEQIKPSLFSQAWYKSDMALIAGLALFKLLLHLPVLARYGYHHDELYFIACGQHLSFGYVDHAPMVPWIAWLSTHLLGESLFGLRIFSVLAGAAAIFVTGLLVKRLGGGRFAQLTAGVAMLIAPVYLRAANMLCLPAFEPLFWVTATYILVRIIQEDNPKLWLWFGVVAGLGLLNKHSMLFFGFGVAVTLMLTPQRKHFKSFWLYAGAGIAFLFFLPNLVWQMNNGWPTLGFLLNLNKHVMSGISPIQFLAGQLLYVHPLNAILWIWGLWYFFFNKEGKTYRILGWMWVIIFLLLMLTGSKIYYLSPAYPPLLAGGAIAFERWMKQRKRKGILLKPVAICLLLLGGAAMFPLSVPVMSIDNTEKFINMVTFGAFKNVYELTGDLRGMFGWQERVETVAEVYSRIPQEQKERVMILASSYGNAGAIDYLGKTHGLPNAACLSMSYWLWGYPDGPVDTYIAVGFRKETMEKVFHQVELAEEVELENVNPFDTPFRVTICRQPRVPIEKLWQRNRPW